MIRLQVWIIYFFIYAFIGWILESAYKTINYKKIINSGFLIGPFVSVYGFGAVILLIIDQYISSFIPLAIRLLIYTIIANIIEYYTGALLEEVFHVKLWDYSHMPFNLNGRICLLHGFYWTLLTLIVLLFLHPYTNKIIPQVKNNILFIINSFLFIYIMIDFLYSAKFLNTILQYISNLKNNFINIPKLKFEKVSILKKRVLEAFPNINKNIILNLQDNLMKIFKAVMQNNKNIKIKLLDKSDDENEFYKITTDILYHKKFNELKNYKHHDSSIYDHVLKVAKLSYKFAKFLKLDYKSTARGALLHDFFFYDWRIEKPTINNKKRIHAFSHSIHAYHNAMKYFTLNKIEKDIIIKHMFPLTIKFPKYKETFLVSIVDKIISSKEFIFELVNIKNSLHSNK